MTTPLMRYQQLDPSQVGPYLSDPDWHLQQKVDGIRARLVVKDGDAQVVAGNGGPSKSTTAAPVVTAIHHLGHLLRDAGAELEIEGEIIGDQWWLFDLTRYRSPDGRLHVDHGTPWEHRSAHLAVLAADPGTPAWVRLVPVAVTETMKTEVWDMILEAGVEGAVLKHRRGTVMDGKRVSHVLKAKVTHTIDCVVLERGPGTGRNGTGNWLKLGLYRKDGTLYEVGRCSTIGKPPAEPGDVVEVRYLYAGAGGRLTQPTHLRTRDREEKVNVQCTTDQLHFVSKAVLTG